MMSDAHQKVTARHMQRQAMLYVRQITLHQVLENTESTARQYALRERAVALGWPTERIVVIDQDLGHSGTMSEAELHVLRARLRGGILNKAQRAALKLPLPMGLAYAEDETVILDPDAQIQQALHVLFATFKRTGSATATVKYFRTQGLLFPHRIRTGPHAGEIHWGPLLHNATLKILRNPRYAGAFCYGRTHTTKRLDGSPRLEIVAQDQWPFLFRDAHAGYISWEEYEANLHQLQHNRPAYGEDRRHGPAREGPALLQGLVICGRCGNRMTLRYHQRKQGTRLYPEYLCQKERIEEAADAFCQQIHGASLDVVIAELLVAQLTPWLSIRPCRCTKNSTSRPKPRSGYAINRWNVLGMRQNWHSAAFYESIQRTASWLMCWKQIGTPACWNWHRSKKRQSSKMKQNNAA